MKRNAKQMYTALQMMAPMLHITPISAYSVEDAHIDGFAVGRDKSLSLPFSSHLFEDCGVNNEEFEGGINMKFLDWLRLSGWDAESHDEMIIYVTPLKSLETAR